MPKKKSNQKQGKADNTTIAVRVEEVLAIRLDGAQFHDIVQYASKKGWGVCERQLRRYIERADELLTTRHEKDRDKLLTFHHAARMALYARCVNAADYGNARATLADEAKLRGLYPAEKSETNITGVVKEFIIVTVDDGSAGAPDDPTPPGTD